jgi:hypothetical protein
MVFSVWSVPRCYKEDKSIVSQLRGAVAEARGQFRSPEEGDPL